MVKLFKRAVQEVVDPDSPIDHMPEDVAALPGSIGMDINLPLLVKDVGTHQRQKLVARRNQIIVELQKIEKEMAQLDVLLDAVDRL